MFKKLSLLSLFLKQYHKFWQKMIFNEEKIDFHDGFFLKIQSSYYCEQKYHTERTPFTFQMQRYDTIDPRIVCPLIV